MREQVRIEKPVHPECVLSDVVLYDVLTRERLTHGLAREISCEQKAKGQPNQNARVCCSLDRLSQQRPYCPEADTLTFLSSCAHRIVTCAAGPQTHTSRPTLHRV